MQFFQRCWGFIVPLMVLPLVGVGFLAVGYDPNLIAIAVMYGTIVIMMLTLAYIVVIDSRKRWPGVSMFERFARVMSFYRD